MPCTCQPLLCSSRKEQRAKKPPCRALYPRACRMKQLCGSAGHMCLGRQQDWWHTTQIANAETIKFIIDMMFKYICCLNKECAARLLEVVGTRPKPKTSSRRQLSCLHRFFDNFAKLVHCGNTRWFFLGIIIKLYMGGQPSLHIVTPSKFEP